jgi:hypothetical protein
MGGNHMNITLNDCPAILKDAVEKYMAEGRSQKIICISKYESMPFKDKTIVSTSYTVSIQEHNYFTTFDYMVESNPNHLNLGIMKNSMTAGEIMDIIKSAEDGYFTELKV